MARFAAVHDVGLGHVDLDDLRVPVGVLFAQALDLFGVQVGEMVGDAALGLKAAPAEFRLDRLLKNGSQENT